jgi:hypothetical protein
MRRCRRARDNHEQPREPSLFPSRIPSNPPTDPTQFSNHRRGRKLNAFIRNREESVRRNRTSRSIRNGGRSQAAFPRPRPFLPLVAPLLASERGKGIARARTGRGGEDREWEEFGRIWAAAGKGKGKVEGMWLGRAARPPVDLVHGPNPTRRRGARGGRRSAAQGCGRRRAGAWTGRTRARPRKRAVGRAGMGGGWQLAGTGRLVVGAGANMERTGRGLTELCGACLPGPVCFFLRVVRRVPSSP